MACSTLPAPGSETARFDHSGGAVNHGLEREDADRHFAELGLDQAELAELLAERGSLFRIFRRIFQRALRAAHAGDSQRVAPGVERVERDDVAAPDFVEQIFLRYRRVFEKQRHGGAAADAHLVFLGADGEAGRAALDDERRNFLAIHFREDDVHVGESAVGDPHLLPVENPVLAVRRQHCARARRERIRACLRLRETIRGEQLAGRDLRQIFLLLRFGAEIDDGNCADSGGAAERDRERSVRADLFGQHRGGRSCRAPTRRMLRECPRRAARFRRLFSAACGHQAFFVLFEIGDQRDDFFGDKLRGRLADQALIVRHVRGRENFRGRDRRRSEIRRRDSPTAKRLSSP